MLPPGAKGIHLVAFFAAGSACLVAAFGITWARWLDPAEERFHPVIWILLGGLGVSLALKVLWGVFATERARWLAFSLVAILVLGFSALTILSVGILVAPLGLLLLGFSLGKLLPYRSTKASNRELS